MQLALADTAKGLKGRFRLPPAVPPFNTRAYHLFSVLWAAAFLLAVIGPAWGLYERFRAPENNSQLLLGSRAGFAVAPSDATRVRFTVGNAGGAAGVRPDDKIIAIYGIPMLAKMPWNDQAFAQHADDPAYLAMSNLLNATGQADVPLTVRDSDGKVRDVTVTTGEQHINAGARALGITPKLLSFIDLLHLISYPFLLWAAWILHRRNARDAVSSLLSLAVLLTMGADQPSTLFLASVGIPHWLNAALFDLGNILLLAGILLFPHGKLSWRLVGLMACLPVLMLLHGEVYQACFVAFMIIAVLMLLRCMREAPSSDLRQQIRWALFGFAGYASLRGISIASDLLKWSAASFGHQLLLEMSAGVSFGLATLVLQLGLLIALLRYRLYDAEAIISRTVSVALVVIVLGAGFAAVVEGVIELMKEVYPEAQTPAAMIGAVIAALFIEPVRKRAEEWAEKHFHHNLLELKHGLPEVMRDLRDVATFEDFIDEVLRHVAKGVLAHRVAFVLGREAKHQIGVTRGEVLRWLAAFQPAHDDEQLECSLSDRLFPLRVRIHDGGGVLVGWLLIGPRPDGTIAGKDEREAIEHIIVPLARSLRVVLNRERERQEMLDLLESHRERIARLEVALGV